MNTDIETKLSAQRANILVVDDDPDLLDSVAFELEQLGMDVARASSGAELLDLVANRGPFDLIVTDITMPWMSGLQVTRSVRNAGLSTPILIITGHKGQQARGLGGKVAVLLKPFGPEELQAAVNSLMPGAAPSPPP